MTPRHLILDFEGRRFQGERPFATIQSKNGAWTWRTDDSEFPFTAGRGDVLAELSRALQWSRQHRGPAGAAVGFVAYDAARQWEPRAFATEPPPDDLSLPDIRLTFCRDLVETDAAHPEPNTPVSLHDLSDVTHPAPEEYFRAIDRLHAYIAAGDIYQANYTQRFCAAMPESVSSMYARLRALHPMPFTALLDWDDLAVISNSPERFLQLRDRQLLAQPIKGTLRRSQDEATDALLRETLQLSAKDRAENVMIVDLLRNDLGRVCEYGSVRVPTLFEVKTFPTLHHLVSTVTGTLRRELTGVDAFRAAFPCGSITGAPKIRAMQIINELEPVRRGIAMGSIGYFGFDGDMDWNIAIRTVTCVKSGQTDNTAYFHAGGGIVADSDPAAEFDEMRLKASALWHLLHKGS